MAKSSNPKRKKVPKTVLKLPDLEQSKSAVLNSLSLRAPSVPTIMRFVSSSNGIALNHDWCSTKRS
jgi:hypothetical protein